MRRRSTVGGALEMFSLPLPLCSSTVVDTVRIKTEIVLLRLQ